MLSSNQKGIAHIFVLLILLLAIPVGLYLIQHPAIFKPKASGQGITFSGPYVKYENGQITTQSVGIKISLSSTLPGANVYKISDNPTILDEATPEKLTEGAFDYIIRDSNPGSKTIFVQFVAPSGEKKNESASIIYQPPSDTIDSLAYYIPDHPDRILLTKDGAKWQTTLKGDKFFSVKDGILPSPDAYLSYSFDDNYIYFRGEHTPKAKFHKASFKNPISNTETPGIWMKRLMKPGEILEPANNNLKRFTDSCQVTEDSQFIWKNSIQHDPNYPVGGDLGTQDVIFLRYNEGEYDEIEILSREWGFVGWTCEEHDGTNDSICAGSPRLNDLKLSQNFFNHINYVFPSTAYSQEICTEDMRVPNRLAPNDFNGDDKSDVGVYRPQSGGWGVKYVNNTDQVPVAFTLPVSSFGVSGDIPFVADFNGDRTADIGVYRPSTGGWSVQFNGYGIGPGEGISLASFGQPGDIPVVADYDGDGKAQLALFRPSTGFWYIKTPDLQTTSELKFGEPGDIPVPADYDGDGAAQLAVYRPSTGHWLVATQDLQNKSDIKFGEPADIPVPGDYNGDGLTDFGMYRPSTGQWSIYIPYMGYTSSVSYGIPGDIPILGDYNSDDKADFGVYRPSTGGLSVKFNGYSDKGFGMASYGQPGDIPFNSTPYLEFLFVSNKDLLTNLLNPKPASVNPSPDPSPSPSSPSSPAQSKKGDLNNDGKVDFKDFSVLLSKWGSTDKDADLNGDGKVNSSDLTVFISNFGK